MLAQQCGLEPGELVWMGGDVHLYRNHADLVEEQLRRTPHGEARLEITRKPGSIFDYRFEDLWSAATIRKPILPRQLRFNPLRAG